MLRIVKIFHEFNVVHIALVDIEDKLKVRLVHSFIIEYKYIMIGYVQINTILEGTRYSQCEWMRGLRNFRLVA